MTTEEAEELASTLNWKGREGFSDLTRRGLAIYESKLKAKLEPEYDNQFIAIEPDSEEYAIANSTGNAMRAMRKRHATGRLLLMKIGMEPEYGLAARILASDMAAGDKAKGNLLQAEMQTGGEVSLEPL
jgi:hypothetical protein